MSANKLDLTERELEGALAIDVVGELTVGSSQELLLEKVRKHVEAGRRLLLINLAECRRVDSAGLGELVTCLVTATRHDARFLLTNVPQQIRGLMKMTNLFKAFEFSETEKEALESRGES